MEYNLTGSNSSNNIVVYQSNDMVVLHDIERVIYTIRRNQIILDRDLSILYQIDLAQMNRQVKRNIDRFPPDFMFQLTKEEWNTLKCQNGISNGRGGDRHLPYAFTEQGVAMLSGLLRSTPAIETNIMIMRAFVSMRRFISLNSQIFSRIEAIENQQNINNKQITEIFTKLQDRNLPKNQGIFFDGQLFDAFHFVSNLIRSAKQRIILIDNYVDDSVLTLLDARHCNISVDIYTHITNQLRLANSKHSEQYPDKICKLHSFSKSHDRWIIIDDMVYHFGASIKDLGKRWFGFALIQDIKAENIISLLNQ